MGNSLAFLALFGSPLVVMLLFRILPRTEALCWTIIGGYLFLPYGVGLDFPVLPTLSKDLIPALSAAVVLLFMGKPLPPRRTSGQGGAGQADQSAALPSSRAVPARLEGAGRRANPLPDARPDARPDRAPDQAPDQAKSPFARPPARASSASPQVAMQEGRLPLVIFALMILLIACQFATAMTNAMPQQFGPRFLSGLRLYDGFSFAQGALFTLLPFWLGQRHLASDAQQGVLLRVMVAGGLLYALPALAEAVRGPLLAGIIYGYYGVDWVQAIRGYGFRPVLFLQHGLWLAIYMAMAVMAAFIVMRTSTPRKARATWTALWLMTVLFLCNSFGAVMVFLIFLPFVFLSLRKQMIFAAVMAVTMMTYPVLRGNDLVPVQMVRDFSEGLSAKRADSLQFRLDNEERLLERFSQQPVFGWGGYGRNRVYDPETGRDISETDGAWIIVLGLNGWVGYLATYGLLGGPILLLALRQRRLAPSGVTVGLCLILAANLVDMISNATLTPVTWLIAGAIAGRLRLQPMAEPAPASIRSGARLSAARRRGAGGALLVLCLLCNPADLPAKAQIAAQTPPPPAAGLAAPLLAFNLAAISDWSPALPFLDLMKTARPFMAHRPKAWEGLSHQELREGGYLDAQGWPLAIPPGMGSVGTVWDWASSKGDPGLAATRAGVYVLRHQGRGRLELSGAIEILAETPGEIVFRNKTGGRLVLNITETAPDDHIRNITLVRQEHLALYEMGLSFHPAWLGLIQDARQIRFMDWMKTNGTTRAEGGAEGGAKGGGADWATRPQVGDATYMQRGVPVEVMVDLANQIGAEPWFTMPAGAGPDYIRNFAALVRDRLSPDLKVHVEYSNELWNWGFAQTTWLMEEAKAAWGQEDQLAWLDYKLMLATRTARIWDEVFGPEAHVRVDNVLGIQSGASWLTGRMLEAPLWKKIDPSGYQAPDQVFDSLAGTIYFGGATLIESDLRRALLDQIRDRPSEAAAWLTERLLDPTYPGAIPQVAGLWQADKALADRFGLDLLAYEGGQHILQGWRVSGVSEAEQALLTDFLTQYVQGPEMARLYQALWQAWAGLGDGPFMQFSDMGLPSKWGAWGLYRHLGDSSPRAAFLERLNASAQPWFDAPADPAYQQGVIRWPGEAGAGEAGAGEVGAGGALLGTDRDDILIGSRADDRFRPGRGRDAVAGQGGRDTLLLEGAWQDYDLTREGEIFRIESKANAGQEDGGQENGGQENGGQENGGAENGGAESLVRFRGIALLGFIDPEGENQLLALEDMPILDMPVQETPVQEMLGQDSSAPVAP